MATNPGSFQKQVYINPAVGLEGDFASGNPRYTVLSGAGALVAGPLGCTVGRYVWSDPDQVDDLGVPAIVNNYGTGPVLGFVHRSQQAMITGYLDGASLRIPMGFGVGDVMISGDFLARNAGTTPAQPGMKAYAAFADGSITFAASGSPTGGATSTASTIAAETLSITGSIAGNILTVTAVGSGSVYPGATITNTGPTISAGTKIANQLSGTPGGIGTYSLNIGDQTIASGTITGTYGLLTVGGTLVGLFAVGDILSGSGVTAGSTITAQLTGAIGGAGTYVVDPTQTVGSEAINVAAINVETKWFCRSYGLAGEIVKISDTPLG